MQPAALFALHCLPGNEIPYIYHITQLTNFTRCLAAFEQALGFLIKNIEPVPRPGKTHITTHDTHIRLHDLIYLFHALGDENTFLVGNGSLIVPLGNIGIEVVTVEYVQGMSGSGIGIHNGFDKRIGSQAVSTM